MNNILQTILTIILIALLSFTISCDENKSNGQENAITDIHWVLSKYFDPGSDIHEINPEEDEYYTIYFNNSGEISAKEACNDCTGFFEIANDDSIAISGISCTEMACDGPPYFSSFNGDYTYQFNDDTLELFATDVQHIFYFVQN